MAFERNSRTICEINVAFSDDISKSNYFKLAVNLTVLKNTSFKSAFFAQYWSVTIEPSIMNANQ